jgi:protein translocase SecG subunit
MEAVLKILQIVFSLLLALAILSQSKGTGLSAMFGGEGGFYRSKRGAEKVLATATVVLAVLWVLNALAFLFV